MKKKVFKRILSLQDSQVIELQCYSKVLSVQMQGDDICLWYLCNPEECMEERKFCIHETEHEVGNGWDIKFLGTVQNNGLVWHVFEEELPGGY